VDFRILGPVEARAEGRPLALAGPRQRALLAVLLLRAGEPVSRERVIADLWGERPPDGAVKTVQAVVSRLRRALGGEATRLVSSAAGYRLRVEPDELDLSRFERLCADGRRALAAGRHERAGARLRAALAEPRPPRAALAEHLELAVALGTECGGALRGGGRRASLPCSPHICCRRARGGGRRSIARSRESAWTPGTRRSPLRPRPQHRARPGRAPHLLQPLAARVGEALRSRSGPASALQGGLGNG
jgi:Bacterial transcriptional activator domain